MKETDQLRRSTGRGAARAFAVGMAVWLALFAVLVASTPDGVRQAGVYAPLGVLVTGQDPETGARTIRPRLAPL